MDAKTKKTIRKIKAAGIRINALPRVEKIKLITELKDFILADRYLSSSVAGFMEVAEELIRKGNGYIYQIHEKALTEIAEYLQARIDKIEVDNDHK